MEHGDWHSETSVGGERGEPALGKDHALSVEALPDELRALLDHVGAARVAMGLFEAEDS